MFAYLFNYKWDTSGSERYCKIALAYFRSQGIIMYMFDLSNAQSLQQLGAYFDTVPRDYNSCIRLLLGCKCDLQHRVTVEEIEAFLQT